MYKNLKEYIYTLEKTGELIRIKQFVDSELQIAEITDRISKSKGGGKALLFEHTGTEFPVLTNMMGSDRRIALALGVSDLNEPARRIMDLYEKLASPKHHLCDKLKMIPLLSEMTRWMPKRKKGAGDCQQVVLPGDKADLSLLPVLKCWPKDGGKFITLPLVNTKDPETGIRNVGMYRMQVFSGNTAGMHWHRHKTGERHYQLYKERNERMPVTVCLGGDPAYTYAATAPLPDAVDEYMLAGFLRVRPVELVRCLTNDLEVPADCDFVIEGYIDPSEEKATEGPFGDHTGFYSLEDDYPVFHVTCITHRKDAVYPATVVGIPPMEDAYLSKATERIFLAPVRIAAQPEIKDIYLPEEGVAHNLAVINIDKSYPAQGLKAANAMWGAGQMMFNKFMFVLSTNGDIRSHAVLKEALKNVKIPRDVLFSKGPLDVLDHAAPAMGYGGKMCVDATVKLPEELSQPDPEDVSSNPQTAGFLQEFDLTPGITGVHADLVSNGWGTLLLKLEAHVKDCRDAVAEFLAANRIKGLKFLLVFGNEADLSDYSTLLWLAGNNADPSRDIFIKGDTLVVDARAKRNGLNGFNRRWPNVVAMDADTIETIDRLWPEMFPGMDFIPSASLKYRRLLFSDEAAE